MTGDEVASALRDHGPSTLEELEEHLGDERDRDEIEAALAEAEEHGQVERVGDTWTLVT